MDNISVNSAQSKSVSEPITNPINNAPSANPAGGPAANNKDTVKDIGVKFTVKHAFGSHATKLDPLQSFAALSGNRDYSDRLIHKVGKQLCIYDPETNSQEFFDSRLKNVVDVLHYTMSPNGRFIAMCESVKHDRGASNSESTSQVSVYSLSTLNRLKTCHYSLPKPFVVCVFCGDPKLLAALSDEPDRHIVVWYWEKEKVFKTCAISLGATVLRAAPSTSLMLTTSGPSALRNWCIAPDGSLKPSNFLPPAKESLDVYSDHLWLPSNLSHHRMVTLVDPDSSNEINKFRKQSVYIFEGSDNANSTSAGSIAPIIPILMELRQTIQLKLDPGTRVERVVPNAKAFLLVGLNGLICMYERTDDKHEPYIESKRFSLGDLHIIGATVYPSEERMVILTKSGRMLTMPLDISIDQIKKGAIGNHSHEDDNSSQGGNNSVPGTGRGGKGDDNASHASASSSLGGLDKVDRHHHGIADLTTGGYHTSSILSADIAFERPLIVTIGADATMRVWNYLTEKCELVHYFRNEEPLACALHTSGFQVLVSFKDRIRMYNILMDKIKFHRETVLKNCKCIRYSNGSQYWAAASGINVCVYETKSFQQLMTYQGHMMTVVRLCWAPGDQVLFSAGLDGNVYGWPIAKDGKIEVISANNRSSAILDIAVDCEATVFPISSKNEGVADEDSAGVSGGNGKSAANLNSSLVAANNAAAIANATSHHRSWMIVSALDGHIRMPTWNMDQVKLNNTYSHHSTAVTSSNSASNQASSRIYPVVDGTYLIYGDSSISVTAMHMSSDRAKLFVGTSVGSLRIYPWPPEPAHVPHHPPTVTSTQVVAGAKDGHHGHSSHGHHHSSGAAHQYHPLLFYEVYTHAGPVVAIMQGPLDNTVISAGADGSVFIHSFHDERPRKTATGGNVIIDPFETNEEESLLNSDVILLALEDVEEHVNQVVELQKLLSETRAKNDFQARKLEFEHNEALKRITEMHDVTINREKENYEKQRQQFDKRIRELMIAIEMKENDHIKIITELENKYEHKLADQLERYDLLSEKMTLLKQKCEGLLESEKSVFLKQINDIKNESNYREKKLRVENRRAIEDKIANESAFREIINQQEDEYEDELKQLIKAAESELITERETILKLRTLVQTKNTKLDQLKKKFVELQQASKARMILLEQERLEKQRLLDTIEHYKANLVEREDALAEKEKIVLELRSKTRTLENFRFVLDHRLQQLSAERGPITSHIEGLEKHIATMYEELVEEFSTKKMMSENSDIKDQKIQWISQDLSKTRQSVREKEQYIAAFKRELGNLVTSMVVGKELEESVRVLYRKFVRGEEGATKSIVKTNAQVTSAVSEIMNGRTGGVGTGTGSRYAHYTDNPDDHSYLSADSGPGGGGGGGEGGGGKLSKSLLQDVEEALVETAKEADRQKKFVERQSHNLKHRLHTHEKESRLKHRHRLHENSDLLFECNELRMENRELMRKLAVAEHDLDEAKRTLHSLNGVTRTMSTQPASKPGTAAKSPSPTRYGDEGAPSANKPGTARTSAAVVSPWIVHNSLPVPAPISSPGKGNTTAAVTTAAGPNTPKIGLEVNNRRPDDLESIYSVHGIPLAAPPDLAHPLAQSMPNLSQPDSSVSVFPNISQQASATHSQSNLATGTAAVAPKPKANVIKSASTNKISAVSLNLPRAEGRAGKLRSVEENVVNKLSGEVESLAKQLDDSIRERDIQRMELSRLRKQLMHLSNQHQALQTQSQLSAHSNPLLNGAHPLASSVIPQRSGVMLDNGALSFPSVHSFQGGDSSLPSVGGSGQLPPLTHADLYGYPSEEDKRDMRIGPANSRPLSVKGSADAKNSSSSSSKAAPSNSSHKAAPSTATKGRSGSGNAQGGQRRGSNGELHQLSLHSADDNDTR
mmetsp:Transcript_15032/g.16277  ORF Transcript_15032/g.16277 Transcript_15032/m.16277 type:complete len:1892 (-) Transcript_15032:105-5780(-)|eukprot:gene6007-6456_t